MSGLLSLDVRDGISDKLARVAQGLHGPARKEASAAMGEEVKMLILVHLRSVAETRHTTAQRLGGEPTGFYEQAVERVAADMRVSADAEGVSISMRHPMVARAFRDLFIEAKRSKALTIPIAGIAYGRRAGEFSDTFVAKGIIFQKTGPNSIMPLFLLRRAVTLKQDRSLMPTNEAMNKAAGRGLQKYVKALLDKRKASS